MGLVACTTSSDDRSASPIDSPADAEAPWGLDDAPLPENQADIASLLEAMPTQVGNLEGEVQGNEIAYGDGGMVEIAGGMETFVRVMTLGGEEYGTGAPFIGAIVQNGGIQIESQDLDPSAPVVYVAGVTPAGDTEYATAMWADPGSRYVVLIQGTSREERAALVSAYRQAASEALG